MQRGDCGVRRAMRGSGTTNVYPPHSIPRSSRLQLARILNLMSITISQGIWSFGISLPATVRRKRISSPSHVASRELNARSFARISST